MGIGTSRQREPENEAGNNHREHDASEQLNDEDRRLRRHLLNEGALSRSDNGMIIRQDCKIGRQYVNLNFFTTIYISFNIILEIKAGNQFIDRNVGRRNAGDVHQDHNQSLGRSRKRHRRYLSTEGNNGDLASDNISEDDMSSSVSS